MYKSFFDKSLFIFAFLFVISSLNFAQTTDENPQTSTENSTAPMFDSPIKDDEIQNNLRNSFLNDPVLSTSNLDLRSQNGVVYLNGTVRNKKELIRAESIALSGTGVIGVENNLRAADEGDIARDWEILESIYNQLYNSPVLESEKIKVTVYNGMVNLSGIVDSQLEKDTAEKIATKAGAERIFNFIEVEHNPNLYEIKN